MHRILHLSLQISAFYKKCQLPPFQSQSVFKLTSCKLHWLDRLPGCIQKCLCQVQSAACTGTSHHTFKSKLYADFLFHCICFSLFLPLLLLAFSILAVFQNQILFFSLLYDILNSKILFLLSLQTQIFIMFERFRDFK